MSINAAGAAKWYRSYLLSKQRYSNEEIERRVGWVDDFCRSVPHNRTIGEVSVRDVVCYFARRSGNYDKPYEWFTRYQVIETFCDALVEQKFLSDNHLKSIFDDTDVETVRPATGTDRSSDLQRRLDAIGHRFLKRPREAVRSTGYLTASRFKKPISCAVSVAHRPPSSQS